ncbi:MAG: DUF6776 family protein [Oceanococcus sp.]
MKELLFIAARTKSAQWTVCIGLGLVLGYGLFRDAPSGGLVQDIPLANPYASCPEKLSATERERRVLREELAYTKQSVVVEQEACFELRKSLAKQEDELSKLNEQLAFYRGIVSPEQDEAGVRIHGLDLFKISRRSVQFRLTLIQPVRQSKDANGRLNIVVEGLAGDVFRQIPMSELGFAGDFSGEYAFRYYMELHGQFRLPEGFKPLRISTEAIPNTKGRKPVRQTFIWQEAMVAQAAEES